ncbi:MAG: hydrolase 2, exosortase A system-associated [Pseudomonadota bacterium]
MDPGKFEVSAEFLAHGDRTLFTLLLEPATRPPRGAVMYLHPFAEEMHKSRHVVSVQARAMASVGYRVLLVDLSGCGDGSGDFVDANWQRWLDDACFAAKHLMSFGEVPLTLWGLRLGALMACELSSLHLDASKLLLWQPVLNGEHQIDQFLRLQTAANILEAVDVFDRKSLWKELRTGHALEVGGYELSAELAMGVSAVRLGSFLPNCDVGWFEIGPTAGAALGRASENVIASWRDRGLSVSSLHIEGPAFWRNHDTVFNPLLQQATLGWLE